ncbi:MAG: hypothetical protein FJ125_00410, partial [Deltaproteobacteria bacterium]|nr:hypothetical protein [Deltaproteobacteria bacterium]
GKKLAEKLRRENPDLLVALGAEAAILSRRELRSFPLVFGLIEDDWQSHDLRSGKQATGVACHPSPEQVLERLKKVAPLVRRIAVLHDPARGAERLRRLEPVFAALKMTMLPGEVPAGDKLAQALARLREQVDAWWLLPDPVLVRQEAFSQLLEEQLQGSRPLIAPSGELVHAGALLAVEADRRAIGIQLADLARRILFGGLSPAELEVQEPERVVWHLNKAAAARIGLEIAKPLLAEVDRLHDQLPPPSRK